MRSSMTPMTLQPTRSSENGSRHLPKHIKFNAVDRMFLVPETDDPHGPHFPMTPASVVTLKYVPTHDDAVRAMRLLERKYPQLRLGYTLDAERNCWRRVPASELDDHLASLVKVQSPGIDVAEALSIELRTNNTPFSHPVIIILNGSDLILKMNHCFGDGRFLLKLTLFFLLALCDPDTFDRQPNLPMHFGLPLWRLLAKKPQLAVDVMTGWVKGLRTYFNEYQRDMASVQSAKEVSPIRSGTEQCVKLITMPPSAVARLNELKALVSAQGLKITVNTLMQVLLGRRVVELGLVDTPPIYTAPVDLRRYLPDPSTFYPGNLATQIRVSTGQMPADIRAECVAVQQQFNTQLASCGPLAVLPGEWLLALGGNRVYKRVYRDWLLASINTDPRLFILSNFGNLDAEFALLTSFLDLSRGAYPVGPLMGGPPIALTFNTLAGQGNFAITYNPRIVSESQIDDIFAVFTVDSLKEHHALVH